MSTNTDALTLLGPYPGNGSVSTWKYFNFLQARVPEALAGYLVGALHPGGSATPGVPAVGGRAQAWLDNYVLWPGRLARSRSNLFHIVDHGLAWYARFLGRAARLITVHDLIPLLITSGKLALAPVPRKRLPVLRECMRQIRAADHLVAVSSNTADCLRRELDVPANRITVIHNFVEPEFRPLSTTEMTVARTKFFGDAEHAVIHVGKHSAYKNRIGALRAFARVLCALPEARMFLVHGAADPEEAAFLKEAGCEHAVRFLGPLSLPDLRQFYGAADVLIFPSIYEGFGWPPVEAMACGCPVVSTPCGSLGEVVADAALVVADPYDHAGLADAAISVLRDAALRRELRERGFQNAERFQPDRMLEHATEVYRTILN